MSRKLFGDYTPVGFYHYINGVADYYDLFFLVDSFIFYCEENNNTQVYEESDNTQAYEENDVMKSFRLLNIYNNFIVTILDLNLETLIYV
ncbi:unnamed protein product [Rhizophagus irregularis]|nr:unnamed protein product [Rhizophagus irregularis]